MKNAILSSLGDTEPPPDLSKPLQALWWLKKGNLEVGAEWETAHEICQAAEGEHDYDWVHALAHRIEGDAGNAEYWYRHLGKERKTTNVSDEWDIIDRKSVV